MWGSLTDRWETYITDANVAKYASGICSGEQISLGEYVWGHTFSGRTHIIVIPGYILILPSHVTAEFGLDIVNLSG